MTFFIIACGSSAENWFNHPHDKSILLNDAYKFGHKGDYLGIWNHRSKFPDPRLQTILSTRPIKMFSDSESWRNYFPEMETTRLRSWDGHLRHDITRLEHAHTSPFIGMSLAYNLGATKIVLFGADFQNHSQWHKGNSEMKTELRAYRQLCDALNLEGVEVILGAPGSLLEEFLRVEKWEK